jgi:hypothetical protein
MLAPAGILSELSTAPAPVCSPHPSGPSSSTGTSSATFTVLRSFAIEYVANDDWPKKCPWTPSW